MFSVKKALLCGALCAAGLVSTIGTAQAAVYTGKWDPQYGTPFPDLGWMGEVDLNVPPECVGLSDCVSSDISLVSGSLTFYDWTTKAVVDTFSFGPGDATINSVGFTDGTLTDVSSSYFIKETSTAPEAMYMGQQYDFYLVLEGSSAQLVYSLPGHGPGCLLIPGPSVGVCGISGTLAEVTYTPAVPEPGTYALMIAGLGVLGFIARRRRS